MTDTTDTPLFDSSIARVGPLAFVFVCNAILRYTIGRKSDDLLVASMEIGSPYPHTFRGFVNLVKQDGKRYCIRPDIYFESF